VSSLCELVKKDLEMRLKRIEGQVRGIQIMIEDVLILCPRLMPLEVL
jgi:DNA-binding FrmR family transcriptional regulator